MKKYSIYAFMSAIALAGAVGFSSCSSSKDDVGEVNPNFNPQTNEVKTQFVLNVSNGNQASTRQSEAATQALTTSAFRGIEDSWVMCYKNAEGDGKSLLTSATINKPINMARVAAAGTLSSENSRRVLEMTLPLNTNTILFYGRAVPDGSDHAAYNTYGHLDDYTVVDNLANVNFQLGRRLSEDDKTKFKEVQRLLAAILSCIMETNRGEVAVAAADAPSDGIPAYGFALPADFHTKMKWSAYDNMTTSPVDGGAIRMLESKLAKAYKELTTIRDAELRNASGYALKESAKQLWSIVNAVRCATPTDQAEALAKYMAQKIHIELLKYFEATVPSSGAGVTGVSFKSAENLISELASDTYWPTTTAGTKPAEFSHISGYTSANMAQFPEQFDLPQGSTHIKFDSDKKTFYYVENYNASAVGGGTFTVDDYYYPAELLYFGNSPIRVSNTEHSVTDYPKTVNLWNTDETTSWPADWSIGHVQSSTRSVAMKNDINYGSSLLQMTVGYAVTTLKDNNHAIQVRDYGATGDEEPDNVITVDGTSFKLVGVIVGDQWPKVGWNFLPKTTDPGNANYRKGYIYDREITNNGAIPASGRSEANYTLVFDNYQDVTSTDATNKQPKVYIALELQNNTGKDFFGKDNLIANGSHFYLIGELDPSTKDGPVKPTYHALPPYDKSQNGKEANTVPRVFIQDHTTTANFTIGENSLKYAYLTVPDLRSSSVTLGLSVDLEWSAGLEFNNVILGGE